MRKRALLIVIAIAAGLMVSQAWALDFKQLFGSSKDEDSFKMIDSAQLAQMIADDGGKLKIFDANPPDFRAREGIIPGAHLLSSAGKYDPATELAVPNTYKLVFYCANNH